MIRVALHNWVCSRVPFALPPTDRHPVGLVVPVLPWRKSNWHWMVTQHKVMQKNWHKTYWRRRMQMFFFFKWQRLGLIFGKMGNLERDQEELLVTCKCLRWNLRYFDIDISLDIFDIYDWYNGLERCARLTCIPGETWLFRNPDIRDRPIIGFMLGGPPSAGWAWKQVGACLGFFRTFEINSARFFFWNIRQVRLVWSFIYVSFLPPW